MSPDSQKSAADVPQLSELKSESEKLLQHLMLEQQSKLRQMIQQLKSVPDTPEDTQSLPDKKVPLEEVSRLQQKNMEYLELLTASLEVTMKTLNKSESDSHPQSGELHCEKANKDL